MQAMWKILFFQKTPRLNQVGVDSSAKAGAQAKELGMQYRRLPG
jgi:hypothetical protein